MYRCLHIATYRTMKEFGLGSAVEFLFTVSIQRRDMRVVCMGENPRPVCLGDQAVKREQEFFLKCDNYISQQSSEDDIIIGSGCHLIKLYQNHAAIDFLVVDNQVGKNSRRLFLIQVSSMKYQNRKGDKRWMQFCSNNLVLVTFPWQNFIVTRPR